VHLTVAGILYAVLGVIGWVALFWALHRALPGVGKKWLIISTTFIAGLFYTLEFFLPAEDKWLFRFFPNHQNPLTPLLVPVGNIAASIGAFSIGLGVLNLCMVHGKSIAQRRAGWHNSAAFVLAFLSMMVFGFVAFYNPVHGKAYPWPVRVYDVLFEGMLQPLQATVFSLLAFYIASAAYRAFRLRSVEATLMMVAAFIVMLGQVPVGMWLTQRIPVDSIWGHLRMEVLSQWLLDWISMAALRAIALGIAIGGLAMSLRIWLSLERGAFFKEEM
jgi:hypothetical protein